MENKGKGAQDAPGGPGATEGKAADDKAGQGTAIDSRERDGKATGSPDTERRGTRADTSAPPKEPPLPPSGMSGKERWAYYEKHKDQYPPHIQDMMGKMKKRDEKQAAEVDAAIREHHAQQLGENWGIPVKTTERIPTKAPPKKGKKKEGEEARPQPEREDTPGGDWEKTNVAARTGERPALSAVSTTKSGAEVQIDEFDPDRRVAREHKSSLEMPGDPKVHERELEERMDRHGEFAVDRDLVAYEWVPTSRADHQKMAQALSNLKAQANNHPDPAVRKKLRERYEKIVILEPDE